LEFGLSAWKPVEYWQLKLEVSPTREQRKELQAEASGQSMKLA
jgi:hypothetical protein